VKTIIERCALFMLLMLATGAGVGIFIGRDAATAASSGGEPIIQVAFGLMYLLVFVFVAVRYRSAVFLVYQEKWIALLCLWCLASVVWSVDPGETFRRSLALIGTSMVGLYVGMRYEPKQLLRILAVCIGIGAIASLVAGLVVPSIGILPDGAWQGVFFLKNALARLMALGALCFAVLAIGQRRYRTVSIGMIVLCFTLMVLAKSATALVVSLMVFALLPFRRILAWPNRRLIAPMIAAALVAVPAALWAIKNMDAILGVLNRESSLTGRLPLWHLVRQEIVSRPLLGYGFSAFWTSSEAARIQSIVVWDVPNAHNGFLEVLLGVGLVGLAILAAGLLANLVRSVRAVRADGDVDHAWPLVFLIFLVFYSLTESSMLVVNSILWMLYSANSYWMVRASLRPETATAEEREVTPAYDASLEPGPIAS
jgi:exopolysaccharide production protein ExoQ